MVLWEIFSIDSRNLSLDIKGGETMEAQEVHQITSDSLPAELPKMTLEEFLESDLEGFEYIKGELIPMAPPSILHGRICTNLFLPLGLYIRENQLGDIYMDVGFAVGDRVLIPDIAFITRANMPESISKVSPVPPDLAVEVVSPSDTLSRIQEKVFAYLEAGTQLVWVLEPRAKTVTVYRSETEITLLTRNDTLSGEDVVDGFSCQVAELFE